MSTAGTKCMNTLIIPSFNLYYSSFAETSVCYHVQVAYSFGPLKDCGISFLMIPVSARVSYSFLSCSQPDIGNSCIKMRSVP